MPYMHELSFESMIKSINVLAHSFSHFCFIWTKSVCSEWVEFEIINLYSVLKRQNAYLPALRKRNKAAGKNDFVCLYFCARIFFICTLCLSAPAYTHTIST